MKIRQYLRRLHRLYRFRHLLRPTDPPPPASPTCGHDFRPITEYAKQCRVKSCGLIVYSGNLPEGLKEYVEQMTVPDDVTRPIAPHSFVVNVSEHEWAGARCAVCLGLPDNPSHVPDTPEFKNFLDIERRRV